MIFKNVTLKIKEIKSKIYRLDYIKLKKFLFKKGNHL